MINISKPLWPLGQGGIKQGLTHFINKNPIMKKIISIIMNNAIGNQIDFRNCFILLLNI